MTPVAEHHRFVGIDVGKKHLDIHLHPEGRHWRVDYTPAGLSQLAARLAALEPQLVVMEASGGYERACADCLAGGGLAVSVINPRLVRRLPDRWESSQKPTRSMPKSSPGSPLLPSQKPATPPIQPMPD